MTTRAERRGLLRRATLTRGALPYTLAHYYVYSLPRASLWTGAHVFVLDDVSGAVEAFSDGVNWRRVTDLAIVSAVSAARLYGTGAATAIADGVAGPYLVSRGTADGIFVGASFAAAGLSGAGAAVATLATPPKEPTDLSAAGAGTATAASASRASAGLSGAGAGAGSLVGVAA